MLILINNELSNDNNKNISANDRGLLLGDGIFTTLKSVNSNLLYFSTHYARLKKHAAVISLNIPYTETQLHEKCLQLIKCNELDKETALIRITITRGISERGVIIRQSQKPTLIIRCTPFKAKELHPLRLCLTSIIRNEYSPITKIKSLNYLESVLAKNEAIERGFDDGIMLNTRGAISECSTANIFFVTKNGEIITPPLSEGVLDGITRSNIIDACKDLNIPIIERSINSNEIPNYVEAFITNCVIGIQNISAIEDYAFSNNNLAQLIQNHTI